MKPTRRSTAPARTVSSISLAASAPPTSPTATPQPTTTAHGLPARLARVTGWLRRSDWTAWALLGLALLAVLPRLYGLNWDAGNHLHPDEREIVFRAMCLSFPGTPRAGNCDPAYTGPAWLLSPSSPLNPHFFAYGSLPLYLLASVCHALAWLVAHTGGRFSPSDGGAWDDFDHFTLVGRALSAFFDIGSVLLTGLLARRLAGRRIALLAAAFVAVTPFEVQVAHFYAVDTLLLCFVLLTLYGCVRLAQGGAAGATSSGMGWGMGILVGASFALAMATKISALPLLVPVAVALLLRWRRRGLDEAAVALLGALCAAVALYLLISPYTLIDWHTFQAQVAEQTALSQGKLDYPYVRQFAGTTPYFYQLRQLLLYDMGLPLGLLGLGGLGWALARLWRSLEDDWAIIVVWLVGYFATVGGAYTKFSRYMLPVFAPLALCGAAALGTLAVWGVRRLTRNAAMASDADADAALAAGPARVWWRRDPFTSVPARRLTQLWGVGWWRRACLALGLGVLASSMFFTLALVHIYSAPNTRVQASQWIYDHVATGATLTNEVWDDPLPIAVPPAQRNAAGAPLTASGHAIDPGRYGQLGLNLYDTDTPQKATQLSQQLFKANVVVISSQRLLRSIPRLPDRYPMTTRYYQLLFAGRLGFTLAAHFETQPHLFGIAIDDSGADESYSVYDHPPVWIFTRQGAGLSEGQIQALLTADVHLPAASNRAGNQQSLLLPAASIAANDQTPAFGVQFPASSLANRLPLLWWLFVVELLGLVSFPLAYSAFPGLHDRGWGLSKVVGLLLLAYLVWLPASLRLLPFDRWVVVAACAALVVAGCALGWRRREALLAFVRVHWRVLVVGEVAFLVAFLFFTWIRALDPDLWHIYRGGEKPMELAFLNGILRSRYMPPADPWFSGGYINYYYYGQFLIAVLIRLTGIAPSTAFNLAVPLLFAMTFAAAYSLVGGLTRRIWAGLAGGVALVVLGNLDGVGQMLAIWHDRLAGLVPPAFDYWQSSRVIPYVIDEFPFWSFLYADLHAHLIDLPVVVLLLACCASLLLTARADGCGMSSWRAAAPTLGVAALALGAAWCINTWDVPTYALLLAAALALRVMLGQAAGGRMTAAASAGGWRALGIWRRWPVLRGYLVALALTLGAAYVLYAPFHADFASFVSGTGPVATPTNVGQFATVFGLWLFLTASFFLLEMRDRIEDAVADHTGAGQRLAVVLIVGGVALLIAWLAGTKVLLIVLLATGLALAVQPRHSPAKLFTYLVLLVGLAIALGVELIYVRDFLDNSPWERMNTVFKFYYQVWTLLALGGALAAAHLLARLAALRSPLAEPSVRAVEPASVAEEDWSAGELSAPTVWSTLEAGVLALRGVWLVALLLLVTGSSIFLLAGTQVRVQDPAVWAVVQPPPGGVQPQGLSLDGLAYMRGWYPGDYAAITWLNDHVGGDPTIVEASNGPYAWFGRVSINTGLPSVLGWSSHESQQRYGDEVYARQSDVQSFYGTSDPNAAQDFLRQYTVRYIYLGALERTCYMMGPNNSCMPMSAGALAKFTALEQAGLVRTVYSATDTVIYQVVGS